jgi:hypothetical protein
MTRKDLEGLDRDALIERAGEAGVARAEVLTRDELISAIEDLEETDGPPSSERGAPRGFLGKMRRVLATFVERGLNLPQAAERIRAGATADDPMPLATMTLAEIYLAQGHQDRSLTVLAEVLRREPGHQAALDLQQRIRTGQIPIPVPPRDEEPEDAWVPSPTPPPDAPPPVYRGVTGATLASLTPTAPAVTTDEVDEADASTDEGHGSTDEADAPTDEVPTSTNEITAPDEPATPPPEAAIAFTLADELAVPAPTSPSASVRPAAPAAASTHGQPETPSLDSVPPAAVAPIEAREATALAEALAPAAEEPAPVAAAPEAAPVAVAAAPEAAPVAAAAAPEAAPAEPPVPALMPDEEPLPESYGVDEVVLMPVDPTTVYAYFEVQPGTLEDLAAVQPGGSLALRVMSPRGAVGVRAWPLPEAAGDLFLRNLPAGIYLGAELGWSRGEQWTPITRSAIVRLARDEAAGPVASRVVEWTAEAPPAVVTPEPSLALGIALAHLAADPQASLPMAAPLAAALAEEPAFEAPPTLWWLAETRPTETEILPETGQLAEPSAAPEKARPSPRPRTRRRDLRAMGSSGLWLEEWTEGDEASGGILEYPAGRGPIGSSELSRRPIGSSELSMLVGGGFSRAGGAGDATRPPRGRGGGREEDARVPRGVGDPGSSGRSAGRSRAHGPAACRGGAARGGP